MTIIARIIESTQRSTNDRSRPPLLLDNDDNEIDDDVDDEGDDDVKN